MNPEDLDGTVARLRDDQAALASGRLSEADSIRARAEGLLQALGEGARSRRENSAASLALANLAAVESTSGDIRSALATVARAEAEAELGGDPVVRAQVYLATASLFARTGEFTLARRWFQRTLALPDLPADEVLLARSNMAGMLRAAGRLEQASTEYDELARELEMHAHALPASRRAVILINMASCWSQVDRLTDAESALVDAEGALGADERPDLWAWIDTIRAWVRYRAGEYADAVELSHRVASSDQQFSVILRGSAAAAGANAVAHVSLPAEREKLVDRLEALIEESRLGGIRTTTLLLNEGLAAVREAQGDLQAAVEHLREAQRLRETVRQEEAEGLQRQEELQIEIVRMQLENTVLRTHQEELKNANRQLERLDAERVRLTRTIVHDMRNLLNVVKLGVSGIETHDPDSEMERGCVLRACDRMESMMMAELVGDDASETRTPETLSLLELVREAAHVFGVLASGKSQTVVVEGDEVEIVIDETTFGRIIDNLLTNAVKYSPTGGVIEARVRRTDHGVEVSVADDGPGFPDIDVGAGLLYGKQFSKDGVTGEGFGIGLHTAYKSTVSLGGTLRLENREQGGACVRVLLPLASD